MLRTAWKSVKTTTVTVCDFDGNDWHCATNTAIVGQRDNRLQANAGSIFVSVQYRNMRGISEIGTDRSTSTRRVYVHDVEDPDELYLARCGTDLYSFILRKGQVYIESYRNNVQIGPLLSPRNISYWFPLVINDNIYMPSYKDMPVVNNVGRLNVGLTEHYFDINYHQYACGSASAVTTHTYMWYSDIVCVRDIRVENPHHVRVNNVGMIRSTPCNKSSVLPDGNIAVYAQFADQHECIRIIDMRSPLSHYDLPAPTCDRIGLPVITQV